MVIYFKLKWTWKERLRSIKSQPWSMESLRPVERRKPSSFETSTSEKNKRRCCENKNREFDGLKKDTRTPNSSTDR